MTSEDKGGRQNQRARTRKDLLQAAARLVKQGRTPTLEEVAQEALVSRATAYRYFPSIEALMAEAAVDVAMPEPDEMFPGDASQDPVERLQKVETTIYDLILANESLLRTMLAHTIQQDAQQSAAADESGRPPRRQNRRTPLIEAALAPARDQFKPADMRLLTKALGIVIGTEAAIVVKDVLQLDDAEARKVKRWAIRALVDAARKPGTQT